MKNFSGLSLLFFLKLHLYEAILALCQLSFISSITTGVMGINGGCLAISWVLVTRELCHLISKLENKASPEANLVQFVCTETLHVIEGEFLGLLLSWKLSKKIYRLLKFFKPIEYFFESIKKIFAIAQIEICSSLRETIWLLYESCTLLSFRSVLLKNSCSAKQSKLKIVSIEN